MNLIKVIRAVSLVVVVAMQSAVYADLAINVTRGYDTKTKIAIVPFLWEGTSALPERVENIITNDFSRTGRFEPLAPGLMLSQPYSEEGIFFRDWRLLNQEYLIIGHLTPVGESKVQVDVALYDIVKGQRIGRVSKVVGIYQLRDLGHLLADYFYERITGVKGIFSTKIAYVTRNLVSDDLTEYRLQISDADGLRARSVFQSNEPIISIAWSGDGKSLAFAMKEGDRWKICVFDTRTQKSTYIDRGRGYTSSPAFSPDGRYLAYVSSYQNSPEIYLYDFQTGISERLTRNSYIDTEPSFSPDSKYIVFTSEKGGRPQIYRYEIATKASERLTFEGQQNLRARYSTDGKNLIFVHQTNGRFNIASMDLASRDIRILTETNLDESPSVAPNGTMLVYATQRGNQGVLAWVSLDGKVTNEMKSNFGDVLEPAWSPYLN